MSTFDEIKNELDNNPEVDNENKGCLFIILFFSKKLWCTIMLLLIAWITNIPLWLSIVYSILAAVNLILPNTRDDETMGWVRVATVVIAGFLIIFT
jgi:hypothetical protein